MNWSDTARAPSIRGKLKRECPHEGFALVGDAPRRGIDIRHQTIAQLIVLRQDVFYLRAVIPEFGI